MTEKALTYEDVRCVEEVHKHMECHSEDDNIQKKSTTIHKANQAHKKMNGQSVSKQQKQCSRTQRAQSPNSQPWRAEIGKVSFQVGSKFLGHNA